MKKKLLSAVMLLLAAVMVFAACGGYQTVAVENPQTNFDYVVTSNGGSAVQYGKYVYFINGTRGYDDPDGNANRWGEVVKGGVYRAELLGKDAAGEDGKSGAFELETDAAALTSEISGKAYGFAHTELAPKTTPNYYEEKMDWVPNTKIAPVTAGTSGYSKGGLFIYDEYLYFATPNNQRSRAGGVQTAYTDFMMMSLDGQVVEKIFTTEGESATKPYGFYKMGDSVYLLCAYTNDDGMQSIVSVRTQGDKVYDAVYLTQEAADVRFPVSDTYDRKDAKVSLSDYVFYTRATENGGGLIAVCRPDGSESFTFHTSDSPAAIEDVRDNLLFYSITVDGVTEVRYTNLHDNLMNVAADDSIEPPAGSLTYKAYENGAAEKRGQISGTVFNLSNYANYTSKYYFSGGESHNGAYMLGISSAGVYMISAVDTRYQSGVQVLGSTAELLLVDGNFMYYAEGDAIYRTDIFTSIADKGADVNAQREAVSDKTIVKAGITADIVAGHIMFFASYDRWTENFGYSFFKNLNREGSESFFVGTLAEADIPDEDELETYWDSLEK